MTRFDQLARQVALLPQDRQDVIADVIEDMLADVANESSVLSDEQHEIVRQRVAEPFDDDVATGEEVETAFARMTGESLLSEAQNEELRQILSQPIEIATDEEMAEVFENWGA